MTANSMNFTCNGCTCLFSHERKLKLHKDGFAGTTTAALRRFSIRLTASPHELLRALLPSLHHLLRALESDLTGSTEPSLLRASLSELLQALEHTPIPCPDPHCKRTFASEKNLKRHYRRHVYTHYECPFCSKPLRNVSQVDTHIVACPDRNGAPLTNEVLKTRQEFFDLSNNKLDEDRGLVCPHLKRTREGNEEGGGDDDERGDSISTPEERAVSKVERGGSDGICGESGGRDEECDETPQQNTVRPEVQYNNVTAAQQESLSFGQNPLFGNGTSGSPSGDSTIIIPSNEASSYNVGNISHPRSWSDTAARASSTTYGTHTEELESQSNCWASGAVQAPAATNYSLVENDVRYAQAPALFDHPFDYSSVGNLFGTQHNDEITTVHSLPLEYMVYGTQHHPP